MTTSVRPLTEHFIGHGRKQGQPKRAFADRDSALEFAQKVYGPEHGTRVYECTFCQQWHISSPRTRR